MKYGSGGNTLPATLFTAFCILRFPPAGLIVRKKAAVSVWKLYLSINI
jgi:hypothetical protein